MLPIGEDTEPVVVERHIPVDLLESIQRLFAEGVIIPAMKGSDNIHQICNPPSLVLNLHQQGLTCTQVGTDIRTMTFGCGCDPADVIHEKSGSPTIALFPPPGMAKRPFTPNFINTSVAGSSNVTTAWV